MGTIDPSDDVIANYSSRGPTWYERLAKPDVAAPGQNLVAPFAPGSRLGTTYPELIVASGPGHGSYLMLSGTSMAAGIESGLVAVMLEASRTRTVSLGHLPRYSPPNAIKAFVEYTALPMHAPSGAPYDVMSQGVGRVNGQGAVALAGSIDVNAPEGSPWIVAGVVPYSV